MMPLLEAARAAFFDCRPKGLAVRCDDDDDEDEDSFVAGKTSSPALKSSASPR